MPLVTTVLLAAAGCLCFYYFCRRYHRAEQLRLSMLLEERTTQLTCALEEEQKALAGEIRAREAAEEARRIRTLFLSNISHEIRTPMNGVIGMTSLLEQTELTSEQRGYTGIIHSCGESLLNVINNVIDLSTIESGTIEIDQQAYDLVSRIEEALAVFRPRCRQADIYLHYEIEKEVPLKIITDGNRLRQILINVIDNAARLTKKGEIVLRVFVPQAPTSVSQPPTSISQPLTPPGGLQPSFPRTGGIEIGFEIKDTGIGISGDPFDNLGLTISDKLIRLLNGHIQITTERGKGSVIIFTIPVIPA